MISASRPDRALSRILWNASRMRDDAVRNRRRLARLDGKASEERVDGRALLATLVGILTTITVGGSDNDGPQRIDR